MRHVVLIALLGISTLAFAGKYQPLHTGQIDYQQGTSTEAIKKAVKKALIQRGWALGETTNTFIEARLDVRKHQAEIKVTWNDGTITISYVDSKVLGYQEKNGEKLIHRNYNKWIITLERDIANFL